jgi:hypothetical protein
MKILNTLLISLLAYSASAQVGIGTSTPSVPLDIEAANAAIDINSIVADPLIHFQILSNTKFTIGVDSTDSKFKIGTTALETGTAVTVQPNGSVGIGTSTPTSLLSVGEIDDGSESKISLAGAGTGNTEGGHMDFYTAADHDASIDRFTIDVSEDKFRFRRVSQPFDFVLTSDGDIGIGTESPGAKLDVTGDLLLLSGTTVNEFSIDGTLTDNSDDAVPTEKAVKTYVDAEKPILTKSITIDAPTAADDISIFRTDVAITIQEVIAVSTGTSPSTTYKLVNSSQRSAPGTDMTNSGVTTSLTTGDIATINDGTIVANNWIWIEITAASGTGVMLTIDIRYTED